MGILCWIASFGVTLRSHRSWIASLLECLPTPVHDYLPIKIGGIKTVTVNELDKKVVKCRQAGYTSGLHLASFGVTALHNRNAWIGGASRASRVLPKVRSRALARLCQGLVAYYFWVSYGRSLRDGYVDSHVNHIKEVQDTYVGYHRSERSNTVSSSISIRIIWNSSRHSCQS